MAVTEQANGLAFRTETVEKAEIWDLPGMDRDLKVDLVYTKGSLAKIQMVRSHSEQLQKRCLTKVVSHEGFRFR